MEKRKKRKKKNKLWILQSVLCAVCMFSAALLYYDYVAVPRQNRELVEELKTCFPEDIPPGGGSPGQKPEQAGREPVSYTHLWGSWKAVIKMGFPAAR